MLDQASLPWFSALNRSLLDRLDDAGFRERIRASTRQMRSLAAEIGARASVAGGDAASALQHVLDDGAAFGAWADASPAMLFATAR